MEYEQRISLWNEIKIRDLIASLMYRVHQYRPGCSRNTVRLAIQEGATTPIRQRIISTAQSVLDETLAKVEDNEQQTHRSVGN